MSPFNSAFKCFFSLKNGIRVLLFSLLYIGDPSALSACDQSGFTIDSFSDNGDGTFTIVMTIQAAGGAVANYDSTWGFYWDVDAPVVSVSPMTLTSANGTSLTAVIAGSNISWGDPNPSGNTPFVDVNDLGPSEFFTVTIIVGSLPTSWTGGGQEGNGCQYSGTFPCLPPFISALPVPPACEGDLVQMSVIATPAYLTDQIIWEPGGLMGETVNIIATETTEYTVTASNSCDEFTLTITVEVTPLPTIFAFEPQLEACEGFPIFMEVLPENETIVTWEPGGMVGNLLIETADPAVTLYTATAVNVCGEASTDIMVTINLPPSIEVINSNETICSGSSIELESEAMFADVVEWLPGGFSGENVTVSPDTTTEYIVVASSNCGVAIDTVTVTVATSDTVEVTLEACDGSSVLYNGIPLAAGSSSSFTFENVVGCDSVVFVVVDEIAEYTTSLALSACEGSTVTYEGQQLSPGDVEDFNFIASNGCDSVVTVSVSELEVYAAPLVLSTCQGSTVTYEGQQLSPGDVEDFTFTAINGCDSTITVTVVGFPNYDINVMLETCTGTMIPYNGQNLLPGTTTVFDLTTINGCDSMVTVMVEELANFATDVELEACTGSTASYNGQPLLPGTVTDFNFVTALGCDSIVTVSVLEVTIIEEEVNLSACAGESAIFEGQPIAAGTTVDFNYTTSQGCDSVVTVMVEELATYSLPLTLEACTGSSLQYNGVELFPGTTTDVTLMTMGGCDSVMTVTVDELSDVTATLQLGACEGKTVNFKGQQLAAGSVTDFTLVSSLGCDSVLTVTVVEYPTYDEPLMLQACTGATILFNGIPLPPGTSVDFTFTTINGCDSVISVTVEEVETIYTELEFETCDGTFINYNGEQLPPGSETDFTFTSINGCDSVVTVVVDEASLLTGTDEFDACAGTTVMYNGQALLPGTVTDFNLVNALGCDSIVTVTVNELETFASPLDLQACTGSSVSYNGQQLAAGTVTDFTLAASNGCDSVVTVTVEEVLALTESISLEACEGETTDYNGQPLLAGSVTDFNFISSQGCDSIVTVSVNELLGVASSLQLSACPGSTANYNGQDLAIGSVTDFTLISIIGCDSVVTVTVEELPTSVGSANFQSCEGEPLIYNGVGVMPGTSMDFTLTAANGCDSVVTVSVEELPSSIGSASMQGCEGEALIYNGVEISPGTSMDFTLTAANGCDSVVTVTALPAIPIIETDEVIEVCEGESAIIFGQVVSSAGVYSESFTSINGCDSIHSVTLDVASDLVVAFSDNISIGLGESISLQPQVPPGTPLLYNWEEDPTLSCFDCPSPVASPQNSTAYFLTVTNDQGCTANADVLVVVSKERNIYIPNSFSPNGDGINDIFMVFSGPNLVDKISSFQVFSRWGEPVFEYYNIPPNDPSFGWDGKYRESEMNPAVFAYMVEVEFVDGVKRLFKGDVMLVK